MLKRKNNYLIKILTLILLFIIIFSNIAIFADLEDDEQIDINEIKNELTEQASAKTETLNLNSRIALIYDRASKTILYDKNANKQYAMASTTKIMTSIVVLESGKLNDTVTIDSKAAGTGGSRLGLKKNDKITVHDLLYGLMLKSGNDAAVALAIYIGGSIQGFSDLMNKKAQEIGLKNSHYITPHGLDADGHYTTAYELAIITDYALNIPKFKEIVSSKSYTITINNQPRQVGNTNELLGSLNGVYGVKTGFTNGAGRCLVTSCKRNDLDIITVVLGADTKKYRTSDSIKLINYAYKNYKIINIQNIVDEQFQEWKRLNENRIVVGKAVTNKVELNIERIKYSKIAVKNKDIDNVKIEVNSLYYLEAPLEKETVIGNAKLIINNEVICVLNIYNNNIIQKKQIKDYFLDFIELIP